MTQKMMILGCGYVGRALAHFWTGCGIEVTATTTQEENLSYIQPYATHAEVLEGSDAETLTKLVEGQEVIVVMVAAKGRDDYIHAYQETAKALNQALASNSTVRQIVYTGSTSVYGDCNGDWVTEERSLNPSNAQTKALAEAENLLNQLKSKQRKVCIFRLGEIVGPDRGPVKRLKNRSGKPFPGDGKNFTNLVHLDDIVSAVDFAVRNELDGTFNLCNDLHLSRKEVYEVLCSQLNEPPVQWEGSGGSIHAGNKRVDSTKIRDQGFVFVREGFNALLTPPS